jgi:O-antigen ligase
MSVDATEVAPRKLITARGGHSPAEAAMFVCGWLALLAFAAVLALALDHVSLPLGYVIAGGVFAILALALVIGRYDVAVITGFALAGIVVVEPAPSDVLFGLAMAVAALTGWFGIRRVPRMATWLVASFLVLNLLSAMDAVSGSAAARFLLITFYLCVFSLWLAAYIDRPQRARWLVCTYLAVAVISAIAGSLALFAHFPGHTLFIGDERRAKALFKDPNVYGPFLVPIALILLEEIIQRRLLRLRRSSMIACFLVLMLGIVFSYSRAAWLNVAVGLTVLFAIVVLRRLDRRVISLLVVMLVTGVAIVGAVLGTGSLSFLKERAKLQSYDAHRFAAQAKGLAVGLDHPFGVGPGQFDVISPISSHSLYVRALSEQGVLGLLVIAVLVLVTGCYGALNVIRGSDTYGISAAALFAAWCGLAVNSFFVDTLHWRHLWLVAALIWAGAARRTLAERSRPTEALRLHRDGLAAAVG